MKRNEFSLCNYRESVIPRVQSLKILSNGLTRLKIMGIPVGKSVQEGAQVPEQQEYPEFKKISVKPQALN